MGLVFELLRSQFIRSADAAALSFDGRRAIAPLNIDFLCLNNFCCGGVSVCLDPIRSRVVFVGQIAIPVREGMQKVFVDVVFNPTV